METLGAVQGQSGTTASVTADAGVPLHRQLFLVLHDEIARGALAPGDPLPTEQSLCTQFGVSRITVRRALADLARQGYIERRHGVGSFVREVDTATAPQGGSYLDELRQIQFETDVEVLELGVRPPPRIVADDLGSADDVLYVARLRRERRTGEPLMVTEAWLPAALSSELTASALGETALYELLSAAGVHIEKMEHELTAEIAGPMNAGRLDTSIGAPLIRVNRIAYASGAPHHVLSIVLSPSRSRVLMTQTGDIREDGGMAIAHDVRRGRR